VLRDVLTGAVSDEVAQAVYGVVVADGAVDAEASAALRDAIRQRRLRAMEPPRGAEDGAPPADAPAITGAWGDSLRLRSTEHGSVASCAHCDAELGPLGSDWRRLVGTVALTGAELGPLVQLPDELVGRQYACPSCATALWVEVVPADGADWTDFRLHPTAAGR
jgi:N-methylhydantoinase B